MKPELIRCPWCLSTEKMIHYHDTEWGVPLHDDIKHFEFIILDAFQAGLSWNIVLNKRENFRKAFCNFDPVKVARFTKRDINKLLVNEGIIRNRLKIEATINNAKAFLKIQKNCGSFDDYIWKFTNGKTIQNKWKQTKEIPSRTTLSDTISKDLIQQGFKFVGSTICYAYMQASGIVNDHLISCYRYK